MNFKSLVLNIENTHSVLHKQAAKAINLNLTLRNYFIGFYIAEYEQNGNDRANYGDKLLSTLSKSISHRGFSVTNLKLYRQFYNTYTELYDILNNSELNIIKRIGQTASDQLQTSNNQTNTISQTASDQSIKQSHLLSLIKQCSFSHFLELIKIKDETQRRFYELLILKTTPSLRELKRQIETLTYERYGFSKNKTTALAELENKITPAESTDLVKTHYCFDFLNIRYPQILEESELEEALINHLQHFLIELGNGFCFEARQKRILIGDEYYSIDLVFYHRILKCHVLIDLKTKHAKHENIGQLKSYIEHYKRKVKQPSDNPPVGILLVTGQNKTLVEYAIADSDKEIFVSQYVLNLPNKEDLKSTIDKELQNWQNNNNN